MNNEFYVPNYEKQVAKTETGATGNSILMSPLNCKCEPPLITTLKVLL